MEALQGLLLYQGCATICTMLSKDDASLVVVDLLYGTITILQYVKYTARNLAIHFTSSHSPRTRRRFTTLTSKKQKGNS